MNGDKVYMCYLPASSSSISIRHPAAHDEKSIAVVDSCRRLRRNRKTPARGDVRGKIYF